MWALLTIWVGLLVSPARAQGAPAGGEAFGQAERVAGLDCQLDPCAAVLPAADHFEVVEGKPYVQGLDAQGEGVGWVVLSTDVTDIKGYSGKPLSTLVGLDTEGVITGARVVHHSEPILLVGIPEKELVDFVEKHVDVPATKKVVVGRTEDPETLSLDAISGATVTVLAESLTIMVSAQALGQDVGVVERRVRTPGHFIEVDEVWTWQRLEEEEVFGRLTVSADEMGVTGDEYLAFDGALPFIDLWFTVVDAPQVGKALLGPEGWAHAAGKLQEDEHLIVVLGNGTSTFKGSGFVRGGLFDRIRVEQGLTTITFRDLDYTNLSGVEAEGAPEFKEGALFVARGGLDPGLSFDLVFLGSRFDAKGGYSRDFHNFPATHRLPRSIYQLDGPDPEEALWRQAWKNNTVPVVVSLWLLAVMAVFAARRFTTAKMQRLQRLHVGFLLFAFIGGGVVLRVQPSVTQVLTLLDSIGGEWRWSLFLSEPTLFVSWIFIAIVTIVWGRGVFCGWTCPYGAFNELLFKLGRLLKLPSFELPDRVHNVARFARYGIAALLVALYLYDPQLGEQAAEVEPFKSTFLVRIWTREWFFIAWWVLLAASSLFVWRPFCRYICPLGAALAVPGSVRISGPYRRDFCSKCKICTRGCEPRAIRPNGTIDPRECLSCMECEANWRDDQVCPPLVKVRRDLERLTDRKAADRESA